MIEQVFKIEGAIKVKKRGFGIVERYQGQGLTLPKRSTKHAAGYDFAAAEDFALPSIWKSGFVKLFWQLKHGTPLKDEDYVQANKVLKPRLVPTGIKAYMQEDEVLILANRSSNPLKRGLILPNGVGVIDADYYNNDQNEGEIFFQLVNLGVRDLVIKKGERIGQGIFMPYLKSDQDDGGTAERLGGFGSSGR
ncbi:dUTP diphosphatase [Loigolactobacillus backii]|uniref:dUTP diphosphatase n=1 Tax=Loigolactobacillus backii TaxID=375175 RepID=UPI0022FD39B9|nr:dUTP diphosphatase [Loigolactobacillus backii]MDA5387524.1 dUTP diphosphatase [Loigolactobacillus backii]MDA5390112.1 dUTP diphosphatase [Loigolactobacillus backii]